MGNYGLYMSLLLSYTKPAEDQIKDVVVGRRAGDLVQRPKRAVKIQQKHFVRNAVLHCGVRMTETAQGISDQRLMARVMRPLFRGLKIG